MKILNLGCGTKTSNSHNVVNIDWSMYLRLNRNRIMRVVMPLLLNGERLRKFHDVPNNILVHDLSKNIPFTSNSIDAVYHSHVLEHFDRDLAESFLREVKRVLRPGGVHRIVVPDLEELCQSYLTHIQDCERRPEEAKCHDEFVSALLEQSVRKSACSLGQKRGLKGLIENLILGDARRRGQTHQWMYDRMNLRAKLIYAGYNNVVLQQYNTSLIPDWPDYGLDINLNGSQYRAKSLYMEAVK